MTLMVVPYQKHRDICHKEMALWATLLRASFSRSAVGENVENFYIFDLPKAPNINISGKPGFDYAMTLDTDSYFPASFGTSLRTVTEVQLHDRLWALYAAK